MSSCSSELYSCSTCNKSFKSKRHLKQHIRYHKLKRTIPCTICGAHFKNSLGLSSHMVVHTDQTPYRCSSCDKSFKRKAALKRHTKIHMLSSRLNALFARNLWLYLILLIIWNLTQERVCLFVLCVENVLHRVSIFRLIWKFMLESNHIHVSCAERALITRATFVHTCEVIQK